MKTVEDYLNLKAIEPNYRLKYGKHSEQFGELHLPKGKGPHPTIILIHGGCWQAQYGLDQLGPLSQALTTLGFAVWNIEFRRLGNGGGFPITFEDVALAADFLKTIAIKYSLDLTKLTTMGHSAGGHLALWLAGRHHLPETSTLYSNSAIKIQHVVSLAGIPDLVEGAKQNICRGACQSLAGGEPNDVPDNYHIASPHFLLPFNIPQSHLVGEKDPIVPPHYLELYINKAKRQDNHVHYHVVPNVGHFEMVMPDTVVWDSLKKVLLNT